MKPRNRKTSVVAPHRNASDLRGLGKLAIDGVTGVTDLVEAMHAAITHLPSVIGRTAPVATTGLPGLVYRSIRGTTRLVGEGVDRSLSTLEPLLGGWRPSARREAMVAALNGVLGDHLEISANPLALRMQLRREGHPLDLTGDALAQVFTPPSDKLLVQVHGLCMNDLQWKYAGHDHGQALERDLQYSALHLHYNSGRRVSRNGIECAALLDQLVEAWPVPIRELTLLCHSMGGLVARSALHQALEQQLEWTRLPIRIVFLGTPHHGAPLERAGSWLDLLIGSTPYSAPFARLGKVRSAGIQDLRHGNLRDADWQDRDGDGIADGRMPMPLPPQVQAYAVAVSTADAPIDTDHSGLRGDGLVPLASALGQHPQRAFDLRIPKSRRWIGYGINHLEMLGSPRVYRQLLRWLAPRTPSAAGGNPRPTASSRTRS